MDINIFSKWSISLSTLEENMRADRLVKVGCVCVCVCVLLFILNECLHLNVGIYIYSAFNVNRIPLCPSICTTSHTHMYSRLTHQILSQTYPS